MRRIRFRLLLALIVLPLMAACADEDQTPLGPVTPTLPEPGGALFERYVALGNSITAGYQAGGIVAPLQAQSYAAILAMKAGLEIGTGFYLPLLVGPGCPQPFVAPLTPAPAAPAGSPCFLVNPLPEGPVGRNLAVPGALIEDLFTVPQNSTLPLYRLITRGEPQVQVMEDSDPSFVSVWVGNNDALAAAVGGVLGPQSAGGDSTLTPLSDFQARVDALAQEIDAAGAQGAALIGVVDAVLAAPILQPGAYFFLARDATGNFNGKPVNNNCSPVTALGQPNPLAANMVSFQVVGVASFPEINCDPNAYPVGDPRRGVYLLDTSEQVVVRTRIAAYNAALAAAADANGWVYVDPNAVVAPYLQAQDAQGRFQFIRKCQLLASAATPAAFQQAVVLSCPVPNSGATEPFAAPGFFGSLISFDGVHPSGATHVIMANALAAAINAEYGTALPTN